MAKITGRSMNALDADADQSVSCHSSNLLICFSMSGFSGYLNMAAEVMWGATGELMATVRVPQSRGSAQREVGG
ncbi:MAG: hypothetical protein WKF77_30665 [Planctomycetaceae bacterium]